MEFSEQVIKNTLVDYPRLEMLVKLLKETEGLEGLVAEVGVYKGGTARLLCENTTSTVLLCDTFLGMPDTDAEKDVHVKGHFGDTSINKVVQVLQPYWNWEIIPGVFPASADQIARSAKYRFVHLDVDIYDSVKNCLEFFIPRMAPGGIIVLDDYNADDCPGAKLAADEIMSARVKPTVQCQAIIRF